jgi:hypothetical protein
MEPCPEADRPLEDVSGHHSLSQPVSVFPGHPSQRLDRQDDRHRIDTGWRYDAAAGLLVLFLGLLFFIKLLAHPSWVLYSDGSDLLVYQIPGFRFLVSEWQRTGELPLWCPYNFAGLPIIGDIQLGAFYPPHLPLYLLRAELIGQALSWSIVAHVVIAGWTMYAYARSRDLNRRCALLSAFGYMFAGKWIHHLLPAGQYVMVGLSWLPLALLLMERSIKQRRVMQATWAGAVMSLVVLSSHPQISFYAMLLIALWTLPLVFELNGDRSATETQRPAIARGLARWIGSVGLCALVAAGIAAIQLLPTMEASTQTTRAAVGMRSDAWYDVFMPLLGLVGPSPRSIPGMRWGEFRTCWGVLWMATALVALRVVRERQGILRVCICLALVTFGLGGAVLFQSLPGFRLFRLPSRIFLVAALPVSLLVGEATQCYQAALRQGRASGSSVRRILVLSLFLAIESSALLGWLGGSPLGSPFLCYWASLLVTFPVAWWVLCSVAADAVARSRWSNRTFELTWTCLLVTDLWCLAWPLVEVRPQEPVFAPSDLVRSLVQHRTDHERVLDRSVPGHPGATPLGFAMPLLDRIDQVRGYNHIDIHRYKEFIQLISDQDGPMQPSGGIENFPIVNKSLLDLLGVRYLLQPGGFTSLAGEPGEIRDDPSWLKREVDPAPEAFRFVDGGLGQLPEYVLYENKGSFPRAFIVTKAEPLPPRSRVLKAFKEANFRQVVFLEDHEPTTLPWPSPRPGPIGDAVFAAYDPNHVIIDVIAGSPGYLVLTDPWYPGWTASVDDHPATLFRADFAFRAVAIPSGRHRVRFDFDPPSLRSGQMITLAAIMIVVLVNLACCRLPLFASKDRNRDSARLGAGLGGEGKDR